MVDLYRMMLDDETGEPYYEPATHEDLAELGYVHGSTLADDLARAGWVKRPVCGECDGAGMQWWRRVPAYPTAEPVGRTCPSCAGRM